MFTIKNQMKLNEITIRYHEKTAAIIQSITFIFESFIAAGKVPDLSKAIQKFKKYFHTDNHKVYKHLEQHFCGMFLISIISETELYFVDIIKEVISVYPHKLASHSLRLSDVLDFSKEELILKASETFLNKIMYKKPSEYLSSIGEILSIETEDLNEPWKAFVEAKARRDTGVHSEWIANEIYNRKLSEVGMEPVKGSILPDFSYLNKVVGDCDRLIKLLYEKVIAKYLK